MQPRKRLAMLAASWALAGASLSCVSHPPEPLSPAASKPAVADDPSLAPQEPLEPRSAKVDHAAEPRPLRVGWTEISPAPSADAERLNREGLRLHTQGDYAAGLAKFDASLAASPSFVWGRYNKACALSRLGKTPESAALMRVLLLEDLPRFRSRFLGDEDLSALRASPEGAAIEASLPTIAEAYDAVLARGVKAFVFEVRPGWTGEAPGADPGGGRGDPQIPYKGLRIGLYDHETSRFVPMAPARSNVYSGLISREHKQAIIAHGQLRMKDMWEVQPHAARATIYSLEDFGDVVQKISGVSSRDASFGFELWFGSADTIYGAHHDVSYAPSIEFFRWKQGKRKKIGWTHDDVPGRQDPPAEMPFGRASLQVIDLAEVVEYRSPTARLVKRRKIEFDGHATKVELGAGHHRLAKIYSSPDPKVFVVLSRAVRAVGDEAGIDMEPHMYDRHVVDLVEMGPATSTRLAKGKGTAAVAWAPDGTLYLQTLDGIHRYEAGEPKPHNDVMAGIQLSLPEFPEEGGV